MLLLHKRRGVLKLGNALYETRACWIWYPGDWEVWLHEQVSLRREMREVIFPPFWRLDSHYSSVIFKYEYYLDEETTVRITAEGQYAVYLDGKDNQRSNKSEITLPKGKHTITISVYNVKNVPALYIEGDIIYSDHNWEVSCYDSRWKPVGSWPSQFHSPHTLPSEYKLETELQETKNIEKTEKGWLVDFGKETFGYLQLKELSGQGELVVYYGESMEEAKDTEHSVLIDRVTIDEEKGVTYTFKKSRALRYVQFIPANETIQFQRVHLLYEYLPVTYRSQFKSSDQRLNDIWSTSMYTFHLNTREFFFDGIKRDRWVWSGDAYQSFLMNYYSFFDADVVKRTLIALRGKDPIKTHINTILDYSLYWFISIYDYYQYTGDKAFVNSQYENMVSLMEFCLSRRNSEGLMEGIEEDWVFIDWADLDNRGEISTIQILLCRSLEAMSLVSALVDDTKRSKTYQHEAKKLKKKIMEIFWDEEKGAILHQRLDGKLSNKITKYPNMFALMFGYLNDQQIAKVKEKVLLNSSIQKIKTPYMRFFELAALCEIDAHPFVLEEVHDYWGGMLDLGATSFWEEYDPAESGSEHLQMYDMPYGKSLCHAWGASPIYLIGKYFLGVRPVTPGFQDFVMEPKLGGLEWFEGEVPIGEGNASIYMDSKKIRVKANHGKGILKYKKNEQTLEKAIPTDGSWVEIDL